MYYTFIVNVFLFIRMSKTGVELLRQVELNLALEKWKLYATVAIYYQMDGPWTKKKDTEEPK
jgi:hypothetical protein